MKLYAKPKRGAASFCVPRTALRTLIAREACVYEVIAYLILARFTDETGRYSSASASAIRRYSGSNQAKGGPIDRALDQLLTIAPKGQPKLPILWRREDWLKHHADELPDGPTTRGIIRYVLPDFDEEIEDRVWFGAGLVDGYGGFQYPLRRLKQCGNIASRLLLAQYMGLDIGAWGGVNPHADYALWQSYSQACKPVDLLDGVTLIRWKRQSLVASQSKAIQGAGAQIEAYWQAAKALEAAGFLYEVVVLLDRAAVEAVFKSGENYFKPHDDAEPVCELDMRGYHGYKPKGEQGVGGFTAKTAGDLGHGVATDGEFNGTYAAFLAPGMTGMIIGIYRLRFRPVNPHNRNVSTSWWRINYGNREQLRLIQHVRKRYKLPPLNVDHGSS